MAEPDNVDDRVLYEQVNITAAKGIDIQIEGGILNIEGPVKVDNEFASGNNLWLSAADFTGSGGGPAYTTFGGATSFFGAWLLDAAAAEGVAANKFIPTSWLTFAADLWWTNQAAGVGDVKWQLNQYQVVDEGNMLTIDESALPAAIPAPLIAVMKVSTLDTNIPNLGGTRAFVVMRDATHASDTLANDAAVIGLNLRRLT